MSNQPLPDSYILHQLLIDLIVLYINRDNYYTVRKLWDFQGLRILYKFQHPFDAAMFHYKSSILFLG